MEHLAKGRKLADRYALIRPLHSGDHTHVWLAHDEALKSEVVLKFCRNDNLVGVNLLNNELNMCQQCIHSGVVRAFELHRDEIYSFLSLEYLPGGSVGTLMGRSEMQFLPPMIQIAKALGFVHQQGVVHRDVKLDNCLFDARGHARLIDFAIASVVGDDGLRSGGSPRSMSAQQKAGDAPQPSDDIYSFGVALYRLAYNRWPATSEQSRAGHPQVVTAEDASALHSVPSVSLSAVIERLISVEVAGRPANMADVVKQLQHVLSEQGNATLPPDEFVFASKDDELINVTPINGPTDASNTSSTGQSSGVLPEASSSESDLPTTPPTKRSGKKGALALLAVYGLLGAIALFYLIPRFASDTSAVTTMEPDDVTQVNQAPPSSGPSTGASSSQSRAPVEPWKLAQQAKLRKDAEAMLEELLTQQFYLEDKQVTLWAPSEFEKIATFAITGDKQFRQERYEEALEAYRQGKEIADQLATRAATILDDTLDAAKAALAAADAALATEKFTLAQAIEPESAVAAKGLQRAQNLDQVLGLVAQAEALEQQGNTEQALQLYRQAKQLDGEWQAAGKGITRITSAQANRAYSRHMSAGFSALEQGDHAEAHSAFERAKRIKPNANEVAEAFAQLETAVRITNVNQIQSRARNLESAGDLRGAEREYQAALDVDNSSQETRDAVRRVRGQAEVDEQLNEFLNDPVRLANDSVYQQAQSLIEKAKAYSHDGSITGRVAQLKDLMQLARVPVRVTFVSDGATDVLLYRVGRLGTFNNETRALRPGEYSAVGTRAGYRDVRVKFSLAPGDSNARIEVICDERI